MATVCGTQAADVEGITKTGPGMNNVVWESPSHDARGSMPIGNGDIGANVWVEPSGDVVFYISKTDAWSENARLLKLALRSFAGRGVKETGGWQQNAIKAACLGLADEAAKLVGRNFSTKSAQHRFPAMWGPNYDWTPDQCHGGVAMIALQRMLVQCDAEKILLLPAWPKEWDVDFKLHAPPKTTVEGKVKDGTVVALKVTPESRRKDVLILKPFGEGEKK